MKVRLPLLLVFVSLLHLPASADAQAERWIARARAAIGNEATLNAVKSIHFTGTLESTFRAPVEGDPGNFRTETARLAIDIIVQHPYQQRMTLRSEQGTQITALDDSDGWVRRIPSADPSKWQMTFLDVPQVKRLRANTWENLAFFRGIQKLRGSVTLAGEVMVDGRECVKLVFTHSPDIVFTRYFAKDSGQLVKTETESGTEIREEGELVVQGIRFPRKLISKASNGQVDVITFETIVVNKPFPADTFAVPALLPTP